MLNTSARFLIRQAVLRRSPSPTISCSRSGQATSGRQERSCSKFWTRRIKAKSREDKTILASSLKPFWFGGVALAISSKSESRARVQVVTPRSSRRIDKTRSRQKNAIDIGKLIKSAAAFAKPAVILVGVVLAVVGYNALAGSRLFRLHRIEVSDASAALRADVE